MSISQNYPIVSPSLNLDFANTKKLDPRVTFARASTATYYDGKTVSKAEENLFTFSQEFDNAGWSKSRVTVTANTTTAPDGTTTADTLIEDTTVSNTHDLRSGLFTFINGLAYTYSIHVKPAATNPRNVITIRLGNAAEQGARFNISTGVVEAVGASATASIISSGNGWYRCIISASILSGALQTNLGLTDGSYTNTGIQVYTGDGTSGIFIWGAQLEQRSSVTAYQPTTTQPITNYIPTLLTASANVARFDHNPVTGESLGLEVEEQRTNLLTYSEQFDNVAWGKQGGTIASNVIVAPDGTLTGDKLLPSSANEQCYLSRSITGAVHTYSIYAKAGGESIIQMFYTTHSSSAVFDLSAGTIVSVSGTGATALITPVGNGWYRCSVSTTQSTHNAIWLFIRGIGIPVVGNGFDGIFLWGAQLEVGQKETSYIKTVASQVTRAADAASMTGTNFSSWYNQAGGTIYIDSKKSPQTGGGRYLRISHSTDNDRVEIFQTATNITSFIVSGGALQANYDNSTVGLDNVKIAMALSVNNFATTVNGNSVVTDTICLMPVGVDRLLIGSYIGGGLEVNTTIRKIAYYPARLTNTQLQALTS